MMEAEIIALFRALTEELGALDAIFAAAIGLLYLDIRAASKEMRAEAPLRREADILLATAVTKMADAVQAMVNKK